MEGKEDFNLKAKNSELIIPAKNYFFFFLPNHSRT